MATHSSVLAWRIPGTGEPGGLPSMGSHRVRHDWSDLAAAGADSIWWYTTVASPEQPWSLQSPSPQLNRSKMAGAPDFVSHRFKSACAHQTMGFTLIGRAQAIDSHWANHRGQGESVLWLADLKRRVLGGEPLSPNTPKRKLKASVGMEGNRCWRCEQAFFTSCLVHCHFWCLPTGILTTWDAFPFSAFPLNLSWTFKAPGSFFPLQAGPEHSHFISSSSWWTTALKGGLWVGSH